MQTVDHDATFSCPSLPWDLIFRIFDSLPANDVALLCRLVCKQSWRRSSQPHHRTAQFILPLPPFSYCEAWLPQLQQWLKQLTFLNKLTLLSSAASSGSESNLALAWALLSPGFAHGMAPEHSCLTGPGAAAVESGHLHLLPWLLQHGCRLDMHDTLEAAAEHCDLAGLQRVWELLGCGPDPPGQYDAELYGELVGSAASSDRDTVAKITWLMAMAESSTEHYNGPWLLLQAATGAASSGRLPVLQWLLEAALQGGGPMAELWSRVVDGQARAQPLARALEAGQLVVADWLVDEAGYPLPQQEEGQGLEFGPEPDTEQENEREVLWSRTAMGGSVDALRWLQGRGVPAHSGVLTFAARAGHLDAVRFLHEECGMGLEDRVLWDGASSGSIPTAQWLLQAGCAVGPNAYLGAAQEGDAAMLRWLALHAKCPWSQSTISDVVERWTYDAHNSTDDLKATVRLLVEVGCPCNITPGAADGAATAGDLPLLRYLHEELGVGFGPETLAEAARGGCEVVLEWLVGAGCRPGEAEFGGGPYVAAVANGDMATLQCLRRLGVPCDEGVVGWAVNMGVPLSAVRWLVEQVAPVDRKAGGKGRGGGEG